MQEALKQELGLHGVVTSHTAALCWGTPGGGWGSRDEHTDALQGDGQPERERQLARRLAEGHTPDKGLWDAGQWSQARGRPQRGAIPQQVMMGAGGGGASAWPSGGKRSAGMC